MATSETFRALLIAALKHPKDALSGLVLADWLQEQGHPRAEVIRQSFTARVAFFPHYRLSAEGGIGIPVEHIVIQLIPQRVAIEFGCRCAEAVMEDVDEVFPGDETVVNVLQAIRSWIANDGTKRAVAEAQAHLAGLNEEAAGIEDLDLDDPDDIDERNLIGAALDVVRGIDCVAAAVQQPARSEKWWGCLSGSLVEFGYVVGSKRRGWQRRLLIPLIRVQDLGL